MKKLMVVGLDGLYYGSFLNWMNEGYLPNLKKIFSDKTVKVLNSTYPPLTLPSWYSMFTGKDPSELKIYGFIGQTDTPGKFSYYRSYHPHQAIWDKLARYGYRSVVINLPMSTPLKIYKGAMVVGMLNPRNAPFTEPAWLTDYIKKNVPDYVTEMTDVEFNRDNKRFINVNSSVRAKGRMTRLLIDKFNPDLLVVIFTETDRIQHVLWNVIKEGDKTWLYRNEWRDIVNFLKTIDDTILEIKNYFDRGSESNTMIVSDHGFGESKESFFVNRWLLNKGYLHLKKPDAVEEGSKYSRLFLTLDQIMVKMRIAKAIYKVLNRLNVLYLLEHIKKESVGDSNVTESFDAVDWEKTIVFHYSLNGGLYFNFKYKDKSEEFKETVLKQIERELARDKLKVKVVRAKEVYRENVDDKAPYAFLVANNFSCEVRSDFNYRNIYITRPGFFLGTGTHRMEGVFAFDDYSALKNFDANNLRVPDVHDIISAFFGIESQSKQ